MATNVALGGCVCSTDAPSGGASCCEETAAGEATCADVEDDAGEVVLKPSAATGIASSFKQDSSVDSERLAVGHLSLLAHLRLGLDPGSDPVTPAAPGPLAPQSWAGEPAGSDLDCPDSCPGGCAGGCASGCTKDAGCTDGTAPLLSSGVRRGVTERSRLPYTSERFEECRFVQQLHRDVPCDVSEGVINRPAKAPRRLQVVEATPTAAAVAASVTAARAPLPEEEEEEAPPLLGFVSAARPTR